MERVETLLHKLQQQREKKATAKQLLLTVQLLQYELALVLQNEPTTEKELVAISMPFNIVPAMSATDQLKETPQAEVVEEKVIEVLQIDEAEVEAELEEIKRNAAMIQQISTGSKPQLLFDMGEEDIPTLAQKPLEHQHHPREKEINDIVAKETISLNDALQTPKTELSEKLTEVAIKDLKKAIGINDRFLYINELFRGDEVMYERSIKTINSFSIWPEAEYWIRRELKTKLGWKDSEPTVQQFDQLVKRRFSAT